MQRQSLWPVWFPYPISWARACANIAVFSAIMQSAAPSIRRSDEASDLVSIILAALVLHFFGIVLGHHCIIKLVKQKSNWFPGWLSWREGLNGSIILILELLSTSIFVGFLAVSINPYSANAGRNFLLMTMAFLIAVAAYLYHYDFLVRERRNAKMANRQTSKQKKSSLSPQTLDPIELELDRLRGEMGLNQMKQRKKKDSNS